MNKPVFPMIYAQIMIRMAMERGLDRRTILEGLNLPSGLFSGALSRISMNQLEALVRRLVLLGGNDPALGYELGLRMGVSTAGVLGAAAMTRATVRSAIEFLMLFRRLATGVMEYRFFEEDGMAVVDVRPPVIVPPDLNRYLFDWVLVGLWRFSIPFAGDAWRDIELWFAYPEPEYYSRYRERLPRCRFDMGVNQICGPAAWLDRPLAHGDPVTAELLEEQCHKELALLGPERDVVAQVKAFMTSDRGYPPLEPVAERLFMSSRTLKRKLQQRGTTYQQLLDDARREEACTLLSSTPLPVEKIGERLGYQNPSGFSTAFRKWTGMSPGAWRSQSDS
ncbi:MAG TPA: AraC family transcriptional regulator ligand-binding domain-containing protein [Solimonas sp.]|nr:AraC family transcriptional regulator ligand-binding domain-containing protein [Solimonas sp.]